MNTTRSHSFGFTIIEIMVSIAIVMLIGGVGLYSFINARSSKELDVTVQTLVFKINDARTNAIAGKGGQNFGIKFSPTSYTYFSGNTYNSADTNNITYSLPSGIAIDYTDITTTDFTLIFSRMFGIPQISGDVILSRSNDPTRNQTIRIGTKGDISVIK